MIYTVIVNVAGQMIVLFCFVLIWFDLHENFLKSKEYFFLNINEYTWYKSHTVEKDIL